MGSIMIAYQDGKAVLADIGQDKDGDGKISISELKASPDKSKWIEAAKLDGNPESISWLDAYQEKYGQSETIPNFNKSMSCNEYELSFGGTTLTVTNGDQSVSCNFQDDKGQIAVPAELSQCIESSKIFFQNCPDEGAQSMLQIILDAFSQL